MCALRGGRCCYFQFRFVSSTAREKQNLTLPLLLHFPHHPSFYCPLFWGGVSPRSVRSQISNSANERFVACGVGQIYCLQAGAQLSHNEIWCWFAVRNTTTRCCTAKCQPNCMFRGKLPTFRFLSSLVFPLTATPLSSLTEKKQKQKRNERAFLIPHVSGVHRDRSLFPSAAMCNRDFLCAPPVDPRAPHS